MPQFEELNVEVLNGEKLKEWAQKKWLAGQHFALIGPTGTGKSTLMVSILPLRKYVIAIDPKGGDSTLSQLQKHGFVPSGWPPSKEVWKDIENGKPARLIIGSHVSGVSDLPRLRNEIALALRDAFDQQGWTVYIDELQIAADRRLMNLGGSIERNLIAARDRKVSMVTSFQRPANVPRAASEMSTYMAIYYTRDTATVDRLGEMTGRPKEQIRGMVKGLPEFCCLIFSRNPRDPVIVTKAEKA